MVATPWFAVGAGLVAVGWIALDSSGSHFRFPNAPQAICRVGQCLSTPDPVTVVPGIVGVTGMQGGQLPLATPSPSGTGDPKTGLVVTSPQPGVQVEYSVQRSADHFIAVFVVIGKRDLGTWTLHMTIPGARMNVIMGARWSRAGPGTGVVSGTPPPWEDAGVNSERFVIMGTGWVAEPSDCQFDGEPCTFSALTDQ